MLHVATKAWHDDAIHNNDEHFEQCLERILRKLLRKGADTSIKNVYEQTPLQYAIEQGSTEYVQALWNARKNGYQFAETDEKIFTLIEQQADRWHSNVKTIADHIYAEIARCGPIWDKFIKLEDSYREQIRTLSKNIPRSYDSEEED
jgi:ankyrin repeat protein